MPQHLLELLIVIRSRHGSRAIRDYMRHTHHKDRITAMTDHELRDTILHFGTEEDLVKLTASVL